MGRAREYFTDEERIAADRAKSKRYYERNKKRIDNAARERYRNKSKN